jgi:membrane-anchored protein YejM (alkaline phosphatase superfamily)
MLGLLFIILLVVGFFAFIGFADEGLKQLALALSWAVMALFSFGSVIYSVGRLLFF